VQGPVIPVFSRRLSMAADVASVQFSRTVERRITPAGPRAFRSRPIDVSPRAPAGAGLSKLNSMLEVVVAAAMAAPSSKGGVRYPAIQPGSVDVLGPIRFDTFELDARETHGRARWPRGSAM